MLAVLSPFPVLSLDYIKLSLPVLPLQKDVLDGRKFLNQIKFVLKHLLLDYCGCQRLTVKQTDKLASSSS